MIRFRRQISVDVQDWTHERKMNHMGRAGTDTAGGAEPVLGQSKALRQTRALERIRGEKHLNHS